MSDTVVKNILYQVLSPRIVTNGSGGYATKIDLKADRLILNDHLVLTNRLIMNESSGAGTYDNPLTGQCGSTLLAVPSSGGTPTDELRVYVNGMTNDSVVFAVQTSGGGPTVVSVGIDVSNKRFVVRLSSPVVAGETVRIGWFIAKY